MQRRSSSEKERSSDAVAGARRRRAQGVRRENQEKKLSHCRLRERVLEEEKAQREERCKVVAQKEKLQKERPEAQEGGSRLLLYV